MGQYYQQSQFTIAATYARDGSMGCFSSCSTPALAPLPYRSADDTEDTPKKYFYVYAKEPANFKYASLVENVEKYPLMSRGWVLQEWLLSRRIVHYANGQVFFACRSAPPRTAEGEIVSSFRRGNPQPFASLYMRNVARPSMAMWCLWKQKNSPDILRS